MCFSTVNSVTPETVGSGSQLESQMSELCGNRDLHGWTVRWGTMTAEQQFSWVDFILERKCLFFLLFQCCSEQMFTTGASWLRSQRRVCPYPSGRGASGHDFQLQSGRDQGEAITTLYREHESFSRWDREIESVAGEGLMHKDFMVFMCLKDHFQHSFKSFFVWENWGSFFNYVLALL